MKNVKTYLFSYQHDGSSWMIEVEAESREDAEARVQKMARATYDGELIAKIPAHAGLPVRFIVWLRNIISHSFAKSDAA